ncbi:Uma2 family endonuclease [Bernardetia sp.]|uniref:Uma2 family endonuclease n=1 Tax=Bernardetia sp. TaxID=1937974 RepID=UPI0025BB196F|nr:Uma2 family endonuclease [Bernardetia sp.]
MQPQVKYPLNEKLTISEYLKLEQDNQQRYEYHDGYAYAMAGGTDNHNKITMNVSARIHLALLDKPCQIKNNDTKLWLELVNQYVYPDAMVFCQKPEQAPNLKDAFTNPVVIIEVLSKSTEGYDRGDKLRFYTQIPSLLHYVLIEQDKVQVDIYSRKNSTSLWDIRFLSDLKNNLELEISDIQTLSIPLSRIYDRVEFESNSNK